MKLSTKIRNVALAAAFTLVPVAVAKAADTVQLEGRVAVANQTAGDTTYNKSVNATTDQVVKVQVWYHNKENADSGKIANNLKVKIDMPKTAGKTQVVNGTISADNSNVVADKATVNLDDASSTLEYIPGSAQWRHNKGTNEAPNWVTETISDQVTNGGIVLENGKPCFNFESNVTVLARVKTSKVSITKQVRKLGEKDWQTTNTAKAGDTLEYLIHFKNEGNTQLNNVAIGDNLAAHTTYVNGTTMLKNSSNPNGLKITSDNVTKGGIDVGSYGPGAGGYVWFQVKIDPNLTCGDYVLTNTGIVRPQGMGEYFNQAKTNVKVEGCKPTPTTTPTTPPTVMPTPTPETPALPETGVEAGVAGLLGTGGLTYAGYFYKNSRKNLKNALKNIVK